MRLVAAVLSLALVGCGATSSDFSHDRAVQGPLIGDKADATSSDSADRSCQVIVRSFTRKSDGNGGFVSQNGTFVWQAEVDVAVALAKSGAVGAVIYRPGTAGTWYQSTGTAVDGGGPTFQRFLVELSDHTTPTAAMEMRSWEYQLAELSGLALLPSGARLFDHNRVSADFDNYELTPSNGFTIAEAPGICPLVQPRSTLVFGATWNEDQHGAIVPGGSLEIDYTLGRLPQCRYSSAGYQLWDLEANVKFEPQGTLIIQPVTQVSTPLGMGPPRAGVPITVQVPLGTTSVQIWFRNYGADGCQSYDSNNGQNYSFAVTALPNPIGWAGDWGNGFSRACTHLDGLSEPIVIDEYIRERACEFIDVDAWVPGTTDLDVPHPEWIWAQVEYAKDGGAPAYDWLTPEGRVGNNQRFRWSLPYDFTQSDWTSYSYAFRFSNDGNTFFRVAKSDGPDGGDARTIVYSQQ